MELTQDLLKEYFDYKDGFLYWKINRQSIKNGDRAGCVNKANNRHYIRINGKNYLSSN